MKVYKTKLLVISLRKGKERKGKERKGKIAR